MSEYTKLSNKLMKLLELEHPPIAISLSSEAPKGVEPLNGKIRLCQMLDKVKREGVSFYTTSEHHLCDGGASSCGLREMTASRKTGEFLHKDLNLFGSTRAARRFLNMNPKIDYGTVKVVTFSPLEKAPFEPDVIVLICNARQGMEIAEANSYETGDRTEGLTGPPICSAVVAAPFLSGEVIYNLGDSGARKFMKIKEDDIFVGIPAERLSEIVVNLGKLQLT